MTRQKRHADLLPERSRSSQEPPPVVRRRVSVIDTPAALVKALAKAKEIASTICENGPLAVEAILRTLHETDGMTEQEALDHEYSYGWSVFASDDAKEGPRAFAEKRKANFQRK